MGGFADGYVEPTPNVLRRIKTEIVRLTDSEASLDTDIKATVSLITEGHNRFRFHGPPTRSSLKWGKIYRTLLGRLPGFESELRRVGGSMALESMTNDLFGTKVSPGSLLTL